MMEVIKQELSKQEAGKAEAAKAMEQDWLKGTNINATQVRDYIFIYYYFFGVLSLYLAAMALRD